MPSIFPFIEKEGKHFAPIVSHQQTYNLSTAGAVQQVTNVVSGTKGVFAKVRFTNDSTDKAELFAVNTQAFYSSN